MNLKLPSVYWTQVFVFASLEKCDLIVSCFLIYQEPMSGAHTLYLPLSSIGRKISHSLPI